QGPREGAGEIAVGGDARTRRRDARGVGRGAALRRVFLVLAVLGIAGYAWSQMDLLGDAFWYIATGRWELAHHAFPNDELFAYTAPHGPWFVNMPISEPLFAWITDRLGLHAVILFCTVTFSAAWSLLWLQHARGGVA